MDVVVEEVSQIWPGIGGTGVVALDRVSHRFQSGRITACWGRRAAARAQLFDLNVAKEAQARLEKEKPFGN